MLLVVKTKKQDSIVKKRANWRWDKKDIEEETTWEINKTKIVTRTINKESSSTKNK